MKLVIVSHKLCWKSPDAPGKYQTDGGFPLQIKAISELFDETKIVVPCENKSGAAGAVPLVGRNLQIRPLSVPKGTDFRRKLNIPFWLVKNGWIIWREIWIADAVHAPVPGDVGTIGMLFALFQRKPLFVRHCGDWFVRRSAAEAFWKWLMERFAGGRNVMLATGGDANAPSAKNANIEWIFSTTLTRAELKNSAPQKFPQNGKLKLIIACRQERAKGTHIVIKSLPQILSKFPAATLDVVGDGSQLESLKARAEKLNLLDKITFHGKVEPKQVVKLMRRAHVFCYPTEAEGFPKVVLEALACGLPVITTKVSVLPRLVSGERGIILDQATAENLAAAVGEICGDAKNYERMSAAAVSAAGEYSLEDWRDFIGTVLRRGWRVSSLSSVN